jgi:hypothetical protein
MLRLEHSFIWYWKLDTSERRAEMTGKLRKTSWAGRLKNEVLRRVKEKRNILCRVKRSKANWTFKGPCIADISPSITNKMQRYTIYLFMWNTLHVSSGTSAHHQELLYCFTASGRQQ